MHDKCAQFKDLSFTEAACKRTMEYKRENVT